MPSRQKRKHQYTESPRAPRGGEEAAMAHALTWLNDTAAVSEWLARPSRDLPHVLEGGKGFAKIRGFLPPRIAEGARLALDRLPAESWERGPKDTHSFATADVEGNAVLLGVARVLARMLPETLPNFAAASYGRRDGIPPHDDLRVETRSEIEICDTKEAFAASELSAAAAKWELGAGPRTTAAAVKDGQQEFSRVVAMVYQLTRGWKAGLGGELVDLETRQRHIPEFNTLIAFNVPRLHEVTAVRAPPGHLRRSIFGWHLKPMSKADCSNTPRADAAEAAICNAPSPDVAPRDALPGARKRKKKRRMPLDENGGCGETQWQRKRKRRQNNSSHSSIMLSFGQVEAST